MLQLGSQWVLAALCSLKGLYPTASLGSCLTNPENREKGDFM